MFKATVADVAQAFLNMASMTEEKAGLLLASVRHKCDLRLQRQEQSDPITSARWVCFPILPEGHQISDASLRPGR